MKLKPLVPNTFSYGRDYSQYTSDPVMSANKSNYNWDKEMRKIRRKLNANRESAHSIQKP